MQITDDIYKVLTPNSFEHFNLHILTYPGSSVNFSSIPEENPDDIRLVGTRC